MERCIVPYFREKDIRLVDLRPIDIQDFYTYCLTVRKVSNNTVIHYHANISKALKYAVRKDLIPTNPIDRVDRPKEEKHLAKFYTDEELNQLIRVVRGDGVEFAVLMAAF